MKETPQTQTETNAPPGLLTETMVRDVKPLLVYEPGLPAEILLQRQAEILDMAFRRIIGASEGSYSNSDRIYPRLESYAAAFRAQSLCLQTVKILNLLKKEKTSPQAVSRK